MREQVASGDMTLKGAKAFVAALSPIKGLVASGDGKTPKTPVKTATTEAPTWNGKTWDQLSNMEKHALASEDRELFNAMKNDHEQRKG